MLFLRHVGRLFLSVLAFGVSARRIGILLAVVAAALVVALAAASSTVVPIAVYPFV